MRITEQILQLAQWDLVPIGDAHPRMFGHIRRRDNASLPYQAGKHSGFDLESDGVTAGEQEAGEHPAADREDEVLAPLHILRCTGQRTAECDERILATFTFLRL